LRTPAVLTIVWGMANVLRIGARGSKLAVFQAEWVAARLAAAHPGIETRIETFRTAGDRDRATPLAHLPGVGFFVKELQTALLEDRIDLAVHSLKDVPTIEPEGLVVAAAVPEREGPGECLVTQAGITLDELPQGAVVGSSSPRRRAMLLAKRPDLKFVDLRGNVETRLQKLTDGVCQATVLARAGLSRLKFLDHRMVVLSPEKMLPPAGQGALGLECRASDGVVLHRIAAIDDPLTRAAVTAERAVCRRLEAGCRTPLGVLGIVSDGRLTVEAWLLSADGQRAIRRQVTGPEEDAEHLGVGLAEEMLAAGAAELLDADGDRP
jgi:hydroxymethylbilane synthase